MSQVKRGSARRLALLWLAGLSLRCTLLAVPPLLAVIHAQLQLDEKEVGLLTALPILLLAGAAALGALIVHFLGSRRALLLGLAAIGLAGAARGLGPAVAVLFGMTFVMGCGVAVCQPALPSLVAEWFPRQVGLATAIYINGLLVGEMLAAGLTGSVLAPLLGGSWELALAVWSLPVVFTIALIARVRRTDAPSHSPLPGGKPAGRWWPDWQEPQTWRLGLLLGLAQIAYWVPNAFLSDFLKAAGRPDQITPALTALNAAQVPASILVALLPGLLVQKRWPLLVDGSLILIGGVGLVLTGPSLTPIWAGLLGFSGALALVLNLALPPLLAEPRDVHRLSAGIFSISYACAFLGPVVGGALWDATGVRSTAFALVIAGALGAALLASRVDLTRSRGLASPKPA